MKLIITRDYEEMSRRAADIVISHMVQKPDMVLGLATGSTPEGLYQKLIEAYRGGTIDFSNVRTFNLDEYYGIDEDNDQSYHYFMKENSLTCYPKWKIPIFSTHGRGCPCRVYGRRRRIEAGGSIFRSRHRENGHIGLTNRGCIYSADPLQDLDQETIQATQILYMQGRGSYPGIDHGH